VEDGLEAGGEMEDGMEAARGGSRRTEDLPRATNIWSFCTEFCYKFVQTSTRLNIKYAFFGTLFARKSERCGNSSSQNNYLNCEKFRISPLLFI
jgi:hypothetical protein